MRNNRASYARVELDETEELGGPEETITLQEEFHGPARVETVQEEPHRLVISNEQLLENESDETVSRISSNCRHTCNILKWCFVVVVVTTLTIVILVLSKQNQERKDSSPVPQTSRLSDTINADVNIDLRISVEGSSCVGPSCFICDGDVRPHLEARHCASSNPLVKNGSCFLCGQTCYSLHDLLQEVKQSKNHLQVVCPGRGMVEFTCCELALMGTLTNYCGEGGSYLCYEKAIHDYYNQSMHEPICLCPHGNVSEHCNKPYTEAASCRCFKSSLKFCGQEQITQCDSVSTNWNNCHVNSTDLGEQYNCLCNKSSGKSDHFRRCPVLNSNPDNMDVSG